MLQTIRVPMRFRGSGMFELCSPEVYILQAPRYSFGHLLSADVTPLPIPLPPSYLLLLLFKGQSASNFKKPEQLGMIEKEGYWVPQGLFYEVKPRDVERRLLACEQLMERQT
nr:hypothetical transcript [Hymenolepis microstoma]